MPNLLLIGGSGLLALNWTRVMTGDWTVYRLEHSRRLEVVGSHGYSGRLNSTEDFAAALSEVEPDLVVNCAGMTNVEDCEASPEAAREVNTDMPARLAIACKRQGVRLVHISTDHLFDDRLTLFSETDAPAPLNVYGRTKDAGEKAVLDRAPDALVVRTNFFGWGTSYRLSFSDSILGTLRAGERPTLFDDVYFTPILMDRLVMLVHQLVEHRAVGLYNVVGDERLTKYDFGVQIARTFGLDETLLQRIRLADRPDLVRRPREMGLSNAKLCRAIGSAVGDVTSQLKHLAALEGLADIREIQRL